MGRFVRWALVAILAAIGLTLLIGGVQLALIGGSLYYVAASLLVLGAGVGVARGKRFGPILYSTLLAVTLVWSLWEVGLDGWALVPRLVAPAVLGLAFLLPPVQRPTELSRWWIGAPILASMLVIGAAALKPALAGRPSPAALVAGETQRPTEWLHWGNTLSGTRYAPIRQIHAGNVEELDLAWRYDAKVSRNPLHSFQVTPLAADGRLYLCTGPGTLAALDQDTGRELWTFRTEKDLAAVKGAKCRGVGYYESPGPLAQCQKRIILTTPDGRLMAVDAADGRLCQSFGQAGAVDLMTGMGEMLPETAVPTSAPTVINGVVIIGQAISDFGSIESPSGVIRGYDAETGALRWAWDAGRPGQTHLNPGETYTRDTPNAWGVFSGDEQLGLVYIGTGNSPPDYYAGFRSKLADEFSASVVAVEVATGKLRWHFRTVNHDLWDYDVSAQPVSVDLPTPAGPAPALIIGNKRGELFVLDRRTGKPIDRVVEKPVPQGAVVGDWTAKTQPYTTGFPSVAGDTLREEDMWGVTPLDQMACRISFKQARYEGQFTPVTTKPTIVYPGAAGGVNWGSMSVDTQRGLMVVNTLHFANISRMIPQSPTARTAGGFEGGVIKFPQMGTPYAFEQRPFLSPLFAPCQKPPYGKISVFDVRTRKLLWSKPLGTAAHSGPFGLQSHLPVPMGVPNLGGSVSTAGGLVFIAAAQDRRLRAYDIASGEELWSAPLPAVGAANPMTYISPKGRQFVVIAAGGHFAIPGPHREALMAYALPERR